ncbi:MAG: hypothetical protein LQ340_004896 [Diploschistes diacapsis]|nr:MAG: hypothetical protein LQ340_004896 [Diploschistes diacapsis]
MASIAPSLSTAANASTTFSLSHRSLKLTSASDIAPHVQPLQASTSHTTISLNGNTIGPDAASHLAPLLSQQKSLTSIDLGDIFTGRLLSEIPPALSSLLGALLECPRLERVDLSDNAFGLNTVEPLVEFLRQHVPLRELVLNNNGLGPNAGAKIAEALVELAGRKAEAREKDGAGERVPELEMVVCGRNRLESGSAAAWARAYRAHASGMKVVRMAQNGIRPEGVVALLRDGLARCTGLEVLDLQDNTFTVPGSEAMADLVGRWKGLGELGVGDCLLKSRGAFVLAEALAEGGNTQLQTLRMQYAEMDAKGLHKLVAAVQSGALPKLRRVEVNGNRFLEDEEAVVRLREVLQGRRDEGGDEAAADEEGWGVDELDDMDEDEDEEDVEELGEREEEEEEREDKMEKLEREKEREEVLKRADQEEGEKVAQKKDVDVDELADALGRTL